jgi:hypothetical protein
MNHHDREMILSITASLTVAPRRGPRGVAGTTALNPNAALGAAAGQDLDPSGGSAQLHRQPAGRQLPSSKAARLPGLSGQALVFPE